MNSFHVLLITIFWLLFLKMLKKYFFIASVRDLGHPIERICKGNELLILSPVNMNEFLRRFDLKRLYKVSTPVLELTLNLEFGKGLNLNAGNSLLTILEKYIAHRRCKNVAYRLNT